MEHAGENYEVPLDPEPERDWQIKVSIAAGIATIAVRAATWQGTTVAVDVRVEAVKLISANGYLVETAQAEPGSHAFGIANTRTAEPHTTFFVHDHECLAWASAEPHDPLSVFFQLILDGTAIVEVIVFRRIGPVER